MQLLYSSILKKSIMLCLPLYVNATKTKDHNGNKSSLFFVLSLVLVCMTWLFLISCMKYIYLLYMLFVKYPCMCIPCRNKSIYLSIYKEGNYRLIFCDINTERKWRKSHPCDVIFAINFIKSADTTLFYVTSH